MDFEIWKKRVERWRAWTGLLLTAKAETETWDNWMFRVSRVDRMRIVDRRFVHLLGCHDVSRHVSPKLARDYSSKAEIESRGVRLGIRNFSNF